MKQNPDLVLCGLSYYPWS